jgi:hypothetical protein
LLKKDAAMITSEFMQTEQLTWRYDGTSVELAVDWSGQGPLVLLLPALSSISTRHEMRPLQERLARRRAAMCSSSNYD